MRVPLTLQAVERRKYRFGWREGNRFELLVDGAAFFPAMITAIDAAERHVLFENYLISSGKVAARFVDALTAAAARGVQIYLLLDAFGALNLSRADRQRLQASEVQVRYFNPLRCGQLLRNLVRDHRKLLLIDGQVAFVGGMGITDDFGPETSKPWRETAVRIEGPVLQDWQAVFTAEWVRATRRPLELPAASTTRAGDSPGRVTITGGFKRLEVKRSLIKEIRSAERRVWLATAYFLPSWKIRRALRRAATRGVDVRLLLPGPETDHPSVRHAGRRHYAQLLRHGVRIYEYMPRFLHAKTYLCDEWVAIGSSNMDRWNLRWNLEANQEIRDPRFAAAVAKMFKDDYKNSRAVDYETWLRRPWYLRAQEWLWGQVDIWLERLGHTRR